MKNLIALVLFGRSNLLTHSFWSKEDINFKGQFQKMYWELCDYDLRWDKTLSWPCLFLYLGENDQCRLETNRSKAS